MASPKAKTGDYPEAIIEEILARLPIKSILRFKSTCKTWYSLIQSLPFIKFHSKFQQDHRDSLFYTDEPYIISFSSLSPSEELSPLRKALFPTTVPPLVVGPLDNGICCVIPQEPDNGYFNFALCNLATREFEIVNTMPRQSYTHYHFGFSGVSHGSKLDYKIVVIKQNMYEHFLRGSVYSVRCGKWNNPKKLDGFHRITQGLNGYPQQALLNGFCHWMAIDQSSENCVVRFNVDDEVLSVIPGPPAEYYTNKYSNHVFKGGVIVVENRLAAVMLVTHYTTQGEPYLDDIDVWLMMGDGSWAKIFHCWLFVQGDITRFLGMSLAKPQNDDDTGIKIERIFFEHSMGLLMSGQSCGIETHSSFKPSWDCWKLIGFHPYAETLYPIHLID